MLICCLFPNFSGPYHLHCVDFHLDLQLKDMTLVEMYYKWENLLRKMSENKCHGCIKLQEHIKLAEEIKRHKEEVDKLEYQMSDEALQQMPDFQGRVNLLYVNLSL